MSRKDRLRKLLSNPHIWKPGQTSSSVRYTLPSGFSELDRILGGGWPVGVLTEILLAQQGVGELRLLMPALVRLTEPEPASAGRNNGSRQICWIRPPHIPYAPALAQHGLNLSRILIVNVESQADALWATEQALRSKACVAVLAWFADIDQRALRRLQLAAESGCCWAVVFRHERFMQQLPAAPLRLHIERCGECLQLEILRNRYGPAGSVALSC